MCKVVYKGEKADGQVDSCIYEQNDQYCQRLVHERPATSPRWQRMILSRVATAAEQGGRETNSSNKTKKRGVDPPINYDIRYNRAVEAEEGAGRSNGDHPRDENGRKQRRTDARHDVNQACSPCSLLAAHSPSVQCYRQKKKNQTMDKPL